ncbi:hypothetical protein MMC15_005136 [Xylographa vitiligo]|nr:hypothetical protein [Xylographa vitiligo]
MISKRWITLPLWALLSPRSDNYTLKLVNIHNLGAPCGLESSIENGIGTLANLSLAEALKDKEQFDTLFIPGRFGVMPLVWDFILLQQIGQLVDCAAHAFTVCTGAMLLAAAGRLDGRKATTNKRLYDEITPNFAAIVNIDLFFRPWRPVVKACSLGARWQVLTSSGIAAGIDAGLAFLSTTSIAPEDRGANPRIQKADAKGDATAIIGFNKEKVLGHAHFVAFGLEYRWHSDPTDDRFVDLPLSSSRIM